MAKKTIFFCGIDKKAVEEAVKTKYGEIVKANEYLEKIFDVSFTMSSNQNILSLINSYFDETLYETINNQIGINYEIRNLFDSIGFVNPRRIKKVLNKYNIIKNIISQGAFSGIFPNVHFNKVEKKADYTGSLFETILVLYLIILHEFYHEIFYDFLNFEKRRFLLNSEYEKKISAMPSQYNKGRPYYLIIFDELNISSISFNTFFETKNLVPEKNSRDGTNTNHIRWLNESLPLIFCPSSAEDILYMPDQKNLASCNFMQKAKTIDNLFYAFIGERYHYLVLTSQHSESTFKSVKEFIQLAL